MDKNSVELVLTLYKDFLTDIKTITVFVFIVLVTGLMCLLGHHKKVLSTSALKSTVTTLTVLVSNMLMMPVIFIASEHIQNTYKSWHIPILSSEFWGAMPWICIAIAALIAKDFSDYWCHRFLHTRLGWPMHAIHHSDTHVNGFTTFRVHALELIVMNLFYIILLSWIGIPSELISTAYFFSSLHNAYVHFEMDIDHGRFNWLLASPRFHRWHHADAPQAYGKNLANMIPLFDVMFGTYYKAGPCHEIMGAEANGIPANDPAKLFLLPFVLWSQHLMSAVLALIPRRGTSP